MCLFCHSYRFSDQDGDTRKNGKLPYTGYRELNATSFNNIKLSILLVMDDGVLSAVLTYGHARQLLGDPRPWIY